MVCGNSGIVCGLLIIAFVKQALLYNVMSPRMVLSVARIEEGRLAHLPEHGEQDTAWKARRMRCHAPWGLGGVSRSRDQRPYNCVARDKHG